MYQHALIGLTALLLASCGQDEGGAAKASTQFPGSQKVAIERTVDFAQVTRGGRLFQQNCAECHGAMGEGDPNWRTLDANGHYPPPPLNGTAHTWHHPMSILRRTVRQGGVPLGGVMPAFADKLSDGDIDAILAWVQTKWPDEVYAAWSERNQQASR